MRVREKDFSEDAVTWRILALRTVPYEVRNILAPVSITI